MQSKIITDLDKSLLYFLQVIMKTQFRDSDGILNSLHNVIADNCYAIFFLLLEASEAFDACMIRRNNLMNEKQKNALLELAKYPLTLKKQVRLNMRRWLKGKLFYAVEDFCLPKSLSKYLVFDYS